MTTPQSALAEWRRFWFLPTAAALGYATSVIHVYAMGPFIEPLQQDFGWTRAQVSSGITISAFISAVFCIPIGMLVDRIGPRRVALIGIVLITSGYALLGTATGGATNWVLLWVILAFGTLWVQATVWTSAVASRFEVSRGMALAVTLSGASVAATVFPILATALIGAFGWRTAFMGMSGLWLALVFPMLLFCFRGAHDDIRRPGRHGAPHATTTTNNAGPAKVLTGVSLGEGLRSATLYKLLIAAGLFSFTIIGAMVHFVPILTDGGADPMAAASMASLIGIFSIVGRLATGMLLDRFPGHYVGAAACLLPICASALLLLDGTNPVSQSVAAIGLGLTLGAEVDVIAYLTTRHFGLKNFGALYGALVMALSMGTAFGPLAAGGVYDYFGSYAEFLLLATGLMTVSAISLLSLGHPPVLVQAAAQSPSQG
ncbi:MAG TPA: MFS transporter [Porticoccaceae bacterium]